MQRNIQVIYTYTGNIQGNMNIHGETVIITWWHESVLYMRSDLLAG